MKKALVQSVCECQAKLGAELDESRRVLRGWAKDRKSGKELVAPAHTIRPESMQFDIGWQCPVCTRNQLRLFDAGSLLYAG